MRLQQELTSNSELEFIENLELAGWQYHDVRPKFEAELLGHRLSFLNSLANEIAPKDDIGEIS